MATKHLWDFLSNSDSATRRQGPGQELCQHPLLFMVGYCSQNRCAPMRLPSAEACWRPITSLARHPAMLRGASAGSLGCPCPVMGQADRQLLLPTTSGWQATRGPGQHRGWGTREGGSAGEGFKRGRQGNTWPSSAWGRGEGRRPEAHNMADVPRRRRAPRASRPAPHPLPRACATRPRLGPGACREMQ